MYKPTWLNLCPSISSQLLTGSCKGKQILVRTCWRTLWLHSTERYHWLFVATLSIIWRLLFLPCEGLNRLKPWKRKSFASFKLKSSVQFLKHCYSLPAITKLKSFKIIESKFSNEEIITFFAVLSCVWFLS